MELEARIVVVYAGHTRVGDTHDTTTATALLGAYHDPPRLCQLCGATASHPLLCLRFLYLLQLATLPLRIAMGVPWQDSHTYSYAYHTLLVW